MEDRNRLLGSTAFAFGGAFVLHTVEHAFKLSDILGTPRPTGIVVAECLTILQFLVLILASFFAAQAFFSPPESRPRGLRDAAALLAAAYGFGLLSVAFTIGVDFSEPHSHAYRIAGVLDGVFLATLIITALLAAIGFFQRDRARRDYLLGWTGIAFMAANLVALTAGVLRSEGYTDENGFGTLTAGLNLETIGLLAAVVAGAIAALAFFGAARSGGSRKEFVARRDLLLTAAAGAYAFFAVVLFMGEAIVAIADSGLGYSDAEVTSAWVAVLARLVSCGAVVCVIAALQPAFARALQRLRAEAVEMAPTAKPDPL
ncbi:MAG TPA: 7TM diverse intracellular signaling domain-containing protein [Solirubrobacterales bacterium]|nr:7TM diverse intracellular signaling domain-containing protein [Solirubrobacterales bacterium]